MKIKMYDKVLLKTGETAFIVDIYASGEAFEADIEKKDGIHTETIDRNEIDKVL